MRILKMAPLAAALAVTLCGAAPARADGDAQYGSAITALALMDSARRGQNDAARDMADLTAQQGMDRSAQAMVELTRLQLILGLMTTAGLGVTIYMTRQSLAQTREGLRLATDNAERQLRAYIGMARFELDRQANGTNLARWKIQNFGQTPADGVRSWLAVRLVDGQPDVADTPEPAQESEFNRDTRLAPGMSFSLAVPMASLAPHALHDVEAGLSSVAIFIIIQYVDAFGKNRTFRHSEIRWGYGMSQTALNSGWILRGKHDG